MHLLKPDAKAIMEAHLDITAPPDPVEISIGQNNVIWVNIGGVCALRVCQIKDLTLVDARTQGEPSDAKPLAWRYRMRGLHNKTWFATTDEVLAREFSMHPPMEVEALGPLATQGQVEPSELSDAEIAHMANRMMGWKLPDGFSPDCFVKFDREKAIANKSWPIGTNLLSVEQAKAMLKYCAAGLFRRTVPDAAPDQDKRDAARLDFITEVESVCTVQCQQPEKMPARYRMIGNGEPWGEWYSTAREAIDAAMQSGEKP
jgi:hypothetical protein